MPGFEEVAKLGGALAADLSLGTTVTVANWSVTTSTRPVEARERPAQASLRRSRVRPGAVPGDAHWRTRRNSRGGARSGLAPSR
jgi:hypothetical protein